MSFLYVKAYYGTCNTFDRCIHKPQLLFGLRYRLQKLGFRVDLIPVEFANYCMLEMCGHEVFRCKLQNLKFNTPWYRDPVCKRAVEAVMASAVKFRRARAYLWFWTLLDHQMFRRSEYAPKDYFPRDVLKKYQSDTYLSHNCEDCDDFKFSNECEYDQEQISTWIQDQEKRELNREEDENNDIFI